jgi:hypothetical protein
VDGRNPAPVDRWFIPLFIGFQPSKVVQDFFHPQYVLVFWEYQATWGPWGVCVNLISQTDSNSMKYE